MGLARLFALLLPLALSLAPAAHGAAVAQAVTPLRTSVEGGRSQVFSARFLTATGQPAAGEMVTFTNDACGFFSNGALFMTVPADANGVASVSFTAFTSGGVTCFVNATAGASVSFHVVTYRQDQLSIAVGTAVLFSPQAPTEIEVSIRMGVTVLYEAEVSARLVPGASNAALAPASANTGQSGKVAFQLTPERIEGEYEIEVAFKGLTRRVAVFYSNAGRPYQDLWWAGDAENGWGMSIVQHGETLFSVIYAYDAAGRPVWYVMPGGTWNATRTAYTGALYTPASAPYYAYDATRLVVGPSVGTATLTFSGTNDAFLDYAIGGATGRKAIVRQPFGTFGLTPRPGVGDLWWGGERQNGWGIAVLKQFGALFAVWLTYDATGAPTWFAMPAGQWTDASTWEGRVYRTAGSPWAGATYNAAALRVTDVGSFRMRVIGTTGITFEYAIEGRSGTLDLSRQPF